MAESRSKKALKNTSCELLLEAVTAICGFILPRLILSHFGSTYNGITASITQFIGCIALLKSGIGSVTRAALYKPLAQMNSVGISQVVNATEKFLRKVALIFLAGVIVLAVFYPFLVSSQFDWFFSFTLVLILSISTFAQYFFGLTYQMVLQADQRNYVISITQIGAVILNTVVSSVLIIMGCSIHTVKLASAIVFVFPPIIYLLYVRKHYLIDKSIPPNYDLISQRWDALGHQFANFVNTNTDIIVTTVFLGVLEVSVYSVFYMVANAVKKLVIAVSSGTTAAFGNMLAKKEKEVLKKRFSQYELLIFMLATFFLATTYFLYIPFVKIYTSGVNDVNYNRPWFAAVVCVAEFFICVKQPYEQMIYAAGRFKQTRNGAFIEAIINICSSIILLHFLGLYGVIIGTIIAVSYRTIRYSWFVSHEIIERPFSKTIYLLSYSIVTFLVCYIIMNFVPLDSITSYPRWFLFAVIVALIVFLCSNTLAFICFRKDYLELKGLAFKTLLKK